MKEVNLNSSSINIPAHLAIIMDGNGRWASKLSKPRMFGHSQGAKVAEDIAKYAQKIGIKHLTLYTFSSENWQRPEREVSFLMSLLKKYTNANFDYFVENKICFNVIGDVDKLSKDLRDSLFLLMEKTKIFSGLKLTLAISYGGRDEILNAVKNLAQEFVTDKLDCDQINEEAFEKYLYTNNLPDPDLIIRTGGEKRLSNFLLWQSAYSELYFTDVLWPDFSKEHLDIAIDDYTKRQRRYGK